MSKRVHRINVQVSREFYDEMRKFCESVETKRGLKKYSQTQFTRDLASIFPYLKAEVTEKNKGKKKTKNTRVVIQL